MTKSILGQNFLGMAITKKIKRRRGHNDYLILKYCGMLRKTVLKFNGKRYTLIFC